MARGRLGIVPCDAKNKLLTMFDYSHYDLLAKYESTDPEFDPTELATIFEMLNLEPTDFAESKLQEYRALISWTLHEQARIMTELGGEYLNLDNLGLRIEAMRYVVQNITKIKSPFMLDGMAGLVGHRADSPLRYGRGRHSETAALAGSAKHDSQS
jgi:hypothetical protein